MSKVNFFKPEDFDPNIGVADDGEFLCTYEWAAQQANAKLEREAPVLESDFFGEGKLLRARILVEPIVQESEERKLLREFVAAYDKFQGDNWVSCVNEVSKKARALLAKAAE